MIHIQEKGGLIDMNTRPILRAAIEAKANIHITGGQGFLELGW